MFLSDMRLARLVCRILETSGFQTCRADTLANLQLDRQVALAIVGIKPPREFARILEHMKGFAALPVLLMGDTPSEVHDALSQARAAGMERICGLDIPRQLNQIIESVHSLLPEMPAIAGDNEKMLYPHH